MPHSHAATTCSTGRLKGSKSDVLRRSWASLFSGHGESPVACSGHTCPWHPRHLWGVISGEFFVCRDTNELAVVGDGSSAHDFPSHAAKHETIAAYYLMVQKIID